MRVNSPGLSPYAAIGLIHVFTGDEKVARTIGTGWMAWNGCIVTAGHVVHDPIRLDGTASRVHVWPGYDHRLASNPAIVSHQIHVHPRYLDDTDGRFDIAVLVPDVDLPQVPRLNPPPPGDVRTDTAVEVAGFPLDQGGFHMYTATGRMLRTAEGRLFYDTDTWGGQSGAPALVTLDGKPAVAAVHVDGMRAGNAQQANQGVLLTEELIAWISDIARAVDQG